MAGHATRGAVLSIGDMAHVLFDNTTAIVAIDPSLDADATAQFAVTEDCQTEQTPALTLEQTLFDEPAPIPQVSEPAYLIEVRPPHGAPRLLAVRDMLDEAVRVAAGVHPGVADVTIREVPLPCDAASLIAAMSESRSWTRAPNGTWSPALPALI
jgi:hypothetical protein